MGILEQVKELQSQGLGDSEISQALMEQGISPLEINNALSQSKIKSAIADDMQPSMMGTSQDSFMQNASSSMMGTSQEYSQQYPQYQQEYPQEYQQYPQYQQPYSQPSISSDTMTEIAEQVSHEKIAEFEKKTGNLREFRTITEAKLANLDERLKKIENIIEKLQLAILGKVSDNMQDIKEIKSEMRGMQETFSKLVNPILDKKRSK
jgi:hypothetical protein